jgi:L-threonylcarbamoyladenylate synthase
VIERLVTISGGSYPEDLLDTAVSLLRGGAVVVHPTETIHGFGCRYDSREAVERIRRIKGREGEKPMILLVPGKDWIERLCRQVPEAAWRLADLFWPGALTIVFRARQQIRRSCPWIYQTVALRQSAHPFTARLVQKIDLPVVSTSLSRSGQALPADSRRFLDKLVEQFKTENSLRLELAIIDEKLENSQSQPSTIVSVVDKDSITLIREGTLRAEEIAEKSGLALLRK